MKDRFSNYAKKYAEFRPKYPRELFEFFLTYVKEREVAWDCGTGNGQVAAPLSHYFKKVYASDISKNQIDSAQKAENIIYSVNAAEKSGFENESFNLVTAAQAIHWFDIEKFYTEVERVGKQKSVLAVIGYSPLQSDAYFNKELDNFYFNIIYSYWDAERKLIDERYKTIPFPFKEIKSPSFSMEFEWSIEEVHGYLTTWSSVQKYIKANGVNPVDEFINKLRPAWGSQKKSC